MVDKDKDFAIASLVCGLLMWVPLFNAVLGPLAIIFGVLGIKRIKTDPHRYGGQKIALVGISLGIIGTVFLLISLYIKIFKPELLLSTT